MRKNFFYFCIILLLIITIIEIAWTPISKFDLSDKLTPGIINNSQKQMEKQLIKHADLNGDKVEEKIILTFRMSDENAYTLTICKTKLDLYLKSIEPDFVIVDIDESDNIKEIAIFEYNNDDEIINTRFYYYTGDKIIDIGSIEGLYGKKKLGKKVEASNITLDGSGRVSILKKGEILHNWYYKKEYYLSHNHYLVNNNKEFYEMGTKVRVMKELHLQKSPNDNTTSLVIKPYNSVTITLTDNVSWCKVKAKDGKEGWFKVDKFNYISKLNLPATEVFFGLD